jgi:hypothetical protein
LGRGRKQTLPLSTAALALPALINKKPAGNLLKSPFYLNSILYLIKRKIARKNIIGLSKKAR